MLIVLTLLLIQGCLGAFDTLWYHEFKLGLPHDRSARCELYLHACRDFIYAVIFGSLAWGSWNGFWIWILIALLISEIIITLLDFVEEDRTRKVPAGERVMHAVMGLTYGAFLAYLVPQLMTWIRMPAGFSHQSHGLFSWLLTAMAAGVTISGLRDLTAAASISTERKVPISI
jgi:uncharacterized protein